MGESRGHESSAARRWILVVLGLAAGGGTVGPAAGEPSRELRPVGRPAPAFEENVGQIDPQVRFRARAGAYRLFLTDREAVLALGRSAATLRISLAGAAPSSARGEGERAGRVFYLSGPQGPARAASRFDRVRYAGAWPGTDVVFRGTSDRHVRFDFELAPGADPALVRLAFEGADRLAVEERGDLALGVAGETVRLRRPVVYQDLPGGRRPVEGRFVADGPRAVRFAVADYDRARPLVIDPTIEFTSYLGTGADEEVLWTEAKDGSVYVSGRTWSSSTFPTAPPNAATDFLAPHCFVSRFTPDGTDLAWSVVFNWTGVLARECGPFALGPNGTVHAAVRLALSGGAWGVAVFAEPTGGTYSGTSFEAPELEPTEPVRLRADDAGHTYLLGSCNPLELGIGNAALVNGERVTPHLFECQSVSLFGNPNRYESVLVKYDPTGQPVWGTFVGGTPPGFASNDRLPDRARALAVDRATGVAWVGGYARSADLPGTAGGLHPSCGVTTSGACMPNAFVAQYDTNQSGAASLLYATYYGIRFADAFSRTPLPWDGTLRDWFSVEDLALEPGGGVSLFGNIRRVGTDASFHDLFVARIDPSQPGSAQLVLEVPIFGAAEEWAVRMDRLPSGDLALAGYTSSPDFPLVDPLALPGAGPGLRPFAAVLSPAAAPPALTFSTLLPGLPPRDTPPATVEEPPRDGLSASAASDRLYVAWTTATPGLGTPGAFQEAPGGSADAVVASVCLGPAGCSSNSPPVLVDVTTPVTAPLWVPSGGWAYVSAVVEDADNDPLTVTWTGPFGTRSASAVSGAQVSVNELFPPGLSTVSVTVADDRGGTATATIEVEVVENTPAGPTVWVAPGNESNPQVGTGLVVVRFTSVAQGGNTFVAVRDDIQPPPPSDRQLGSPPYHYDVRTTAVFATPPTLCVDIRGHGFADPAIAVHQHTAGGWVALPSTVEVPYPGGRQICAPVLSLGPAATTFAVLSTEVPANRIRKLAGTTAWDTASELCTGPGPDPNEGGAATASRLHLPQGAAYDASRGALYFAETCGFRVRRLDLAAGTIHTLTGTGYPSLSAATTVGVLPTDTDALSTNPAVATLNRPGGVALDPAGNLYVADGFHCRIRKLSLDAAGSPTSIVTVVGTGTCGYAGDGGSAASARLQNNLYIRTDAAGALYVSDGPRVRRVDPGPDGTIDGSETIVTVAGGGTATPGPTPVPPTSLSLGAGAAGLALAPSGDVYVTLLYDVLRIAPDADGRVDGTAGEAAALVRPTAAPYWPVGDSLASFPNGDLAWGFGECRGWPAWECFGRVTRRTAGADGVVNGSPDETEDPIAGYVDWAGLPRSVPSDSDGDGHGLSARLQVPVTVQPLPNGAFVVVDHENGQLRLVGPLPGATTNRPPVANAGPDQTGFPRDPFDLDGSASSDPDGQPLTYAWTVEFRPLGSSAVLQSPTSPTPRLVPDRPGTYVVRLVVSDGALQSAPDEVRVTAIDSPPTADAGPNQTGFPGDAFDLDGSASSDPDGQPLAYAWTVEFRPLGSSAALQNPTSPTPRLTPDRPGTYVVRLVVNDGVLDSLPDEVVITAIDRPPVANAGPDRTLTLTTPGGMATDAFVLDGSASSDPDGVPLAYRWTIVSRPSWGGGGLTDADAVRPAFYPQGPGVFVVRLVVDDGNLESVPDDVTLTVVDPKPVANAGPDQSVHIGSLVSLAGSAIDPNGGDIASWDWSVASRPAGSTAVPSPWDQPSATFLPDRLGTYVLRLSASDGWSWSDPDTVVVTATNAAPVARAGADRQSSFFDAATLDLDGSASSDPDGDPIVEWSWWVVSRPAGSSATIDGATTPRAFLRADVLGTYVVGLQVSDGWEWSAVDEVRITIANEPPAAVADAATSTAGNAVRIDVLANDRDPEGDEFVLTSFTAPAQGTVERLDPPASGGARSVLLYRPGPGAAGTDAFTYTVAGTVPGGAPNAATGTVTVTLLPNRPPVPVADAASVPAGGFVDLWPLDNDSDPDGDPVRLVSAGTPALGSVWVDGFRVSYQAFAGVWGTDTFTYTIADTDPYDGRTKSTATGTITVTIPPPPNVAVLDTPGGRVQITSPPGTFLENVLPGLVPASPAPPAGFSFPYGLIGFTVTGLQFPGQTIAVRLELPAPVTDYWKLQNGAWLRMASAQLVGSTVVLTLTDGGVGDADGSADGVIVDPGGPAIASPSTARLLVSARSDRSAPRALDGSTLRGTAYVFVGPSAGIARVRFWVDQPGLAGPPLRTDVTPEFDLLGSTPAGRALPLPTRVLGDGPHVISAEVTLGDGSVTVLHGFFDVRNRRVRRSGPAEVPRPVRSGR